MNGRPRRFAPLTIGLGAICAALLKARGLTHLLDRLYATLDQSTALRLEWVGATRFSEARFFFLKHRDQAWSFSDCVSFCVMKELRLRDALTKDVHFRQAGFTALLG